MLPIELKPASTPALNHRASPLKLLLPLTFVLFPYGCNRNSAGKATSATAGQSTAKAVHTNNESSPSNAAVRASPADPALRVALASQFFSSGEIFAGIEQLEVARSLETAGSPEKSLLLSLSQRYDSIGEPEAASELLAPAAADADTALALSHIYLELGDFRRSAEVLKPLVPKFPSLGTDAQQFLVTAFLLAGDPETADRLLHNGGTSPSADRLDLLGLKDLVARNPSQACEELQQSIAINPSDAWTRYLLGKSWLAAGDANRAATAWSAVAKAQSPPSQALIGLAGLMAKEGNVDQADALLDRVQGVDRKLPSYWRAAALIARKRKHTTMEGIASGFAAYNEGDPWQAESTWSAALNNAADDLARQIYSALSNSAMRRADAETALHYAGEAARRWPNDPETLRQYAETLLAQSQLNEAIVAAQRFQTVAPADRQAQAAELLSRIALDAVKPDLLQANVGRARALAPADPMPLLHLAEWQGKQGHDPSNLEKTLALYREAREIAPNNAEAAARAGVILADLKRNTEAISTLLHALTLSPRVMDGTPSALLLQLYQRSGYTYESKFEAKWYERVRALKETWPTLLKTMRQPSGSDANWKALGEMALRRHENWIALCALSRRVKLNGSEPTAWEELAMAQKRFGWFDEALESMIRAHTLRKNTHKEL